MTLFVVLVFGAGAVLLISGWENTSLQTTIHDVWTGSATAPAASKAPVPLGPFAPPLSLGGTPFDQHSAFVRSWVVSQGKY